MKVTIIGAGAVGTSCAEYIAMRNFASKVILLDVKEGLAEGKAMDLMQMSAIENFETRVIGVNNDYEKTKNSDIVVVTSGMPRRPGMSREELINVNIDIVSDVTEKALEYSPEAIIILVTNPVDTISYFIHKKFKLPKNRIIGMGGALDTARFRYRLAEALNCPVSDVDGLVIGSHTDTGMIPLISKATRNGVSVSEFLSKEQLDNIVKETKLGGATLVRLLGTSAWYAPGSGVAGLVHSILSNQKKMIPCSALLDGEYGEKDISIGVPCIIGRRGIEKIIEFPLNSEEIENFRISSNNIREMNKDLKF